MRCYQVQRSGALPSRSWSKYCGLKDLQSIPSVEQGDEPNNYIGAKRYRVTQPRNIQDIHSTETGSHCSSRDRTPAEKIGGSVAGLIDKQTTYPSSFLPSKARDGSLLGLYLTTCRFCSTELLLCSLTDAPLTFILLGVLRLPRPTSVEAGHREGIQLCQHSRTYMLARPIFRPGPTTHHQCHLQPRPSLCPSSRQGP